MLTIDHALETVDGIIYPVEIGEFITIPFWRTYGMVIDLEPAIHGPDGSFRACVQEVPDGCGVWYHLEPGQWALA